MKKHIRKKKGIALIAMLLSIFILAGCGKEDTAAVQTPVASAVPEETSSPEATDAPESATTPETSADKEAASHGKGKYTIEEIAQDVVINGQKVSIPFTLEDLGADYTFDDVLPPHKAKKGYTTSVVYKDELDSVVTVSVQSNDGKLERTSEIFGIMVDRTTNHQEESFVKGLGIGDTVDKMREIFGEADEVVFREADEVDWEDADYYYGDKEGNRLLVGVREGKIHDFDIIYQTEKEKKSKGEK